MCTNFVFFSAEKTTKYLLDGARDSISATCEAVSGTWDIKIFEIYLMRQSLFGT